MKDSQNNGHSNLFLLMMFLAMISWGGSWATARWASSYPPELTAFWRFLISGISFVPILILRRESFLLSKKSWMWVGLSALTLGIYNLLFLTAMQHGPGGYGGVLVPTMNPLFSFSLSLLFLGQKISLRTLGGLALGLGGGFLQILGPNFSLQSFLTTQNMTLMAAALVYAVLTMLSSRAQKDMSVFQYSFWTALLCSVFLGPFAWSGNTPGLESLKADFWINVLYLALAAGTFGTTLYFEAARRVGGARASSFAFLVPVSALVLAYILLGEIPAWTSLAGGALSVIAVFIIAKSR